MDAPTIEELTSKVDQLEQAILAIARAEFGTVDPEPEPEPEVVEASAEDEPEEE